jgi:hypothetical protein
MTIAETTMILIRECYKTHHAITIDDVLHIETVVQFKDKLIIGFKDGSVLVLYVDATNADLRFSIDLGIQYIIK